MHRNGSLASLTAPIWRGEGCKHVRRKCNEEVSIVNALDDQRGTDKGRDRSDDFGRSCENCRRRLLYLLHDCRGSMQRGSSQRGTGG